MAHTFSPKNLKFGNGLLHQLVSYKRFKNKWLAIAIIYMHHKFLGSQGYWATLFYILYGLIKTYSNEIIAL